jgi:hypothetical protein
VRIASSLAGTVREDSLEHCPQKLKSGTGDWREGSSCGQCKQPLCYGKECVGREAGRCLWFPGFAVLQFSTWVPGSISEHSCAGELEAEGTSGSPSSSNKAETQRPRERLFIARNASGRTLASDKRQSSPGGCEAIGASSSPKSLVWGSQPSPFVSLAGCWPRVCRGGSSPSARVRPSAPASPPTSVQATTTGMSGGPESPQAPCPMTSGPDYLTHQTMQV